MCTIFKKASFEFKSMTICRYCEHFIDHVNKCNAYWLYEKILICKSLVHFI